MSTSTTIQIPKKETSLIALNKFKKIRYFGICKVEINTADKFLILKTNTAENGLQELTSTFNRIFIQKENALCVIDGTTNKDFIIIFPRKEICVKILDAINKAKFPNASSPTSDLSTNDYLFKNNFYVPILKEIQHKINGFIELQTIIIDLVNTFEADERQKYMNMVFELLLTSDSAALGDNIVTTDIKKGETKVRVKDDDILNDSFLSNDQSFDETAVKSSRYGFRKRSRGNISQKILSKSNNSFSTSNKSKLSEIQSSNNTFTSDYEIVECLRHGAVRTRLLIFTSTDKTHCYEYYYSKGITRYPCVNCEKRKYKLKIKMIPTDNGNMEFKYGINNQHICQPIQYLSENYTLKELVLYKDLNEQKQNTPGVTKRIITLPNFELFDENVYGKTCSNLIVYDKNDRSLYHEYSLLQICKSGKIYRCLPCKSKFLHVSAKLITDDDGNNVVELGPKEHVCNSKAKRSIQKSNFKIEMEMDKNGKEIKMLTVTDPEYGNQILTYRFHLRNRRFYCTNCIKKRIYVMAKIRENQNGEKCIELSDVKHVCL